MYIYVNVVLNGRYVGDYVVSNVIKCGWEQQKKNIKTDLIPLDWINFIFIMGITSSVGS